MKKHRLPILVASAGAALALGAAAAQAHVTVHPNALPSGQDAVINVVVPNEEPKPTIKVDVQLPTRDPRALDRPDAGWRAKVAYRKLAKPVTLEGEKVTEEAARVTWTATGGGLHPGQFAEFSAAIVVPEGKKGTVLTFKAVQTYKGGPVVRWIGAPGSETPAPQIVLRGENDSVQDYPAGVRLPSAAFPPLGSAPLSVCRSPGSPGSRSFGGAGAYETRSPRRNARSPRHLLRRRRTRRRSQARLSVDRHARDATRLRRHVRRPLWRRRAPDLRYRGRRIVVEGYEGEPYLLFTRDAVYRNERSPATYLNDDRYGQVDVPKTANAKAAPVWKPVAAGVEYAWHDHRIHWMSTVPPPVVRNAKDVPHHIFDWTIPGTVDGKPMTIAGSLDYSPPGGGLPWEWILAGLVVLAAAATWAYQRWRSPRRSA